MGNYVGLGNCVKCGKAKIDVHGEIRCLSCEAEHNPPSGLVVKIDDPGEEKMRQVLAASGVVLPKTTKQPEVVTQNTKVAVPVSFEERIQQVCEILKTLPMPKDINQFKAINKAIKAVEKILGE
jgi:hypothetical protein